MTPFGAKLDVLRRIAIDLEGDSDADRVHFGIQLDRILNGGESFEEGLGLPTGWFKEDQQDRRDTKIGEIAATDFPGRVGRDLARAIFKACRRYQDQCWPRDRDADRRPGGPDGRIFDLLKIDKLQSFANLRVILNKLAG
jgi:hypothetical protein